MNIVYPVDITFYVLPFMAAKDPEWPTDHTILFKGKKL